MKKTTITFTALPTLATGTAGVDGKLRLSVFIAPRLWTTDPAELVQILHLNDYDPLFNQWPSQIAGLEFGVSFNGGPSLPATPVNTEVPRDDLWTALFPGTIPVRPYRFDNLAEIPIQSIDSIFLYDWLRELYRKVGTDPAYGAGKEKPSREVLQHDPDLMQIARPSKPERPYEPPSKRRVPIYYRPGETEEKETEKQGCLQLLLDALNAIARLLGLGQPFHVPAQGASAPFEPRAKSPARQPLDESPLPQTPPRAKPLAGKPPVPTGGAQATNPVMAQFNAVTSFVTPFESAAPPAVHLTETQLENLLDFHEAISLVADYPTLLRALRLVVDLEVDWPANIPATGMVAVTIAVPPGENIVFYPLRTHYTLSSSHFLPATRPLAPGESPETHHGLLNLSDEGRYRIIQIDVVGAALKEQNTATLLTAQQVPGLQPINPPDEETLPATRSAGLAIVQHDLAKQLYAAYVQAVGLNNAVAAVDGSPQTTIFTISEQPKPTDELWAEDVIRGYRMDVRDLDSTSKKWRSLHQRQAICRFTGVEPALSFPIEDEGFVQLGVTEPVSDTPDVQRIPDTIVTWTGWSLSAVRPGKAIGESNVPDEAAETPSNAAKTAFKLEADFSPVSGSLPRLRFGHRYHVRVRTVDLAGNSVFGPGDVEFQQAHPEDSGPHTYRRFEPVPAPVIVLREKPVEGESVERLVLRSASGAGDPYHVGRQVVERHIVPPKSSQLLAETHGKFDDGSGKPKPDQATYEQATLEANMLTHRWVPLNNQWVQLLLPGTETYPDAEERKDPTFWQTKPAFPLTYLPDELARRAVFRNLPGPAEGVVSSYPFNGDWPTRLPFRLKVIGIPAGQTPQIPEWNPQERELVVELPQGESRMVRVSSGTDEDDLAQLGVWDWETSPPTANHNMLVADAAQGLNWLLMPPRELYLVHATQKPLALPKLHITKAERVLGDTTAAVSGSIEPHSKTTGKVDVLALWTDPDDDPAKDSPGERRSRAALCEIHVPSTTVTSLPVKATHNLGDTKYHRVVYVARGATRFREYLPPELLTPDKEDLITVPTEAEIKALTLKTAAEIEAEITGGTLPHGDIQDVKNSVRPLAPVVAYVMPTLGHTVESVEQTRKMTIITRTRHNSGLRVYLERPWFSSGAGELLGVVFREEAFATLEEALRPYVTEWADDPLWNGPAADPAPAMANFANYTASSADVTAPLTLEETGAPVEVVGFPVEFDAARKLWFADVEFSTNGLKAYMPMIRLALVRFQPISVPPAYISRVTRADFIQPLPDRTLTIKRLTSNPMHLTVTLSGVAPSGPRPVQAWMEKLMSPEQGDLGWARLEDDAFKPVINTESSALWEGAFFIPGFLPPNARYRIVVQELEPLLPGGFTGTLPDGAIGGVTQLPTNPFLGRTVYADTWEL